MQWFKLYAEFASDPKVQGLSETMQRRLIMLYCLRCQGDLAKLNEKEIALALRIPLQILRKTRDLFVAKGFMTEGWDMPKWEARQAPTDPTAAQRMRNYRMRLAGRNGEHPRNGISDIAARARESRGEEQEEAEIETGPDEQPGARAPADSRHVTDATDAAPDRAPAPDPELAPAWVPLQRLAVELGGDPSWHAWTRRMAALGFPPDWVEQVLRTLAGRGQLRPALAHGILEKYRNQGGPDRREAGPRPRAAAAPSAPGGPRRLGDVMPRLPAGPAGEALRKMWGSTTEAPPAEGPP